VLDRLDAAGLWYCVEGGWGIDALLGEQTREHVDVDLGVRLDQVELLRELLSEFEADEREWPASLRLQDGKGRRVDAHPLTIDERGDGWQANLEGGDPYRWPREEMSAEGRIGGRAVRCITPELQLRWHDYEGADDVDWADMVALSERFGLPEPGERPGFIAPKRTVDETAQPRHKA
jgi:lincosamide nucleotidyltransferase A/C/D/E